MTSKKMTDIVISLILEDKKGLNTTLRNFGVIDHVVQHISYANAVDALLVLSMKKTNKLKNESCKHRRGKKFVEDGTSFICHQKWNITQGVPVLAVNTFALFATLHSRTETFAIAFKTLRTSTFTSSLIWIECDKIPSFNGGTRRCNLRPVVFMICTINTFAVRSAILTIWETVTIKANTFCFARTPPFHNDVIEWRRT